MNKVKMKNANALFTIEMGVFDLLIFHSILLKKSISSLNVTCKRSREVLYLQENMLIEISGKVLGVLGH